jgi:epoxyqueuosine reductase
LSMSIEQKPSVPKADKKKANLRQLSNTELKKWLTKQAQAEGFDLCRVTHATHDFGNRLEEWLTAGYAAGMEWMADRKSFRASPRSLWPDVKSVITLGLNYGPDTDPLATIDQPGVATLSVYARGRDYHDVIKGKLKQLAQGLVAQAGGDVKVFVDTAPVMEKPLAQAAGIGWQGKHSVLVSRTHGNWLFLGMIYTTLELPADEPEEDHCGSCRRCLAACPTDAFPSPYVLDSRRCISYLTIEHHGPIDRDLRPLMGNRVFGCDDCLAVCPWNKFAVEGREAKLAARDENRAPSLVDLLALDEPAFRQRFTASPIKRTGHARFLRNVLIAAGNAAGSATTESIALAVQPHLSNPDAVIRGAAVWALSRLDRAIFARMRLADLPTEKDQSVRDEWQAGDMQA